MDAEPRSVTLGEANLDFVDRSDFDLDSEVGDRLDERRWPVRRASARTADR